MILQRGFIVVADSKLRPSINLIAAGEEGGRGDGERKGETEKESGRIILV